MIIMAWQVTLVGQTGFRFEGNLYDVFAVYSQTDIVSIVRVK